MWRAPAIVILCGLAALVAGRVAAADAPTAVPPPAPQIDAATNCDKLAAPPVPLSPQAAHPGSIDWQQAIAACTQAAGDHPEEPRYEFELGRANEQTKNYADAMTHYKAAADAGSGDGMQALGVIYYKGLGIDTDKEKAFILFYRAAEAGNALAFEDLGAMFGNGDFVQRDDTKALEYFAKSVAAGNAGALGQVGVAFVWGRGNPVDYKMAANYFQQAADLGDGFSLKYLAVLYERGLLGPPDKFKAVQLRQKAQEVDPNSQDPNLPPTLLAASRPGGGNPAKRPGGGVVGGQGVIDPNGPRSGVVATWRDPNANNQFYTGAVERAPTWHGIPVALPRCWPMCSVK
jgi:uncharacterized protein